MSSLSIKDASLALMMVPGIGKAFYARLMEEFGSPIEVWRSRPSALRSIGVLPEKTIHSILAGVDMDALEMLKNDLGSLDAWFMTIHDEDYPPVLRDIHLPPPVLFGVGDRWVLKQKAIAIVGSRKASSYGRRVARELAQGLCAQGFVVVSGLAMGIDSAAHEGALSIGGLTVAVIGCGLDVNYPVRNKGLKDQIARNGVVISEFLPGTRPEPGNFPARNRIISGLSQAVVVVEAGPGSGSLITAYLGMEQGREVMAVPGSIYSFNSKGCHQLIREGAALITGLNDIIREIGGNFFEKGVAESREKVKVSSLSQDERHVVDNLEAEPQHIDEIAARCNMAASLINPVLLQLELKGLVISHPGGKYSIKDCDLSKIS